MFVSANIFFVVVFVRSGFRSCGLMFALLLSLSEHCYCSVFEALLPEPLQANTQQLTGMSDLEEKGLAEWELRKAFEMGVMVMGDDEKLKTLQVGVGGWVVGSVFSRVYQPGLRVGGCAAAFFRGCIYQPAAHSGGGGGRSPSGCRTVGRSTLRLKSQDRPKGLVVNKRLLNE